MKQEIELFLVYCNFNRPRWSQGNEIQGSWVQTRLRSMDFFQDVKIPSTSPSGGTLSRKSYPLLPVL